jgi:DNA polymerase I
MGTPLFPPGNADVLYLVDLSGYVFRAYHAIRTPLTSPAGEPTHAVLGTVNMLERLVRERRPALLAVAMDSRTPTFRKELYPAYKANRPAPPDDLKVQMRRVAELIHAFPIHCFQCDGVEADDLIATVVVHARNAGLKVVIVSADKDLMQLVSDDVVMWDTMFDRVIGPEEVRQRFLVPIELVRDALALMGDTSDNIPGVAGVGPKTAAELLNEYGSIQGIYERLDTVKKKKLKESLAAAREQALLSQELVTLKHDVPIEFLLEPLRFGRVDSQALRNLYTELGFTRHLKTLDGLLAERALVASGDEPAPEVKALPTTPIQATLVTDSALLQRALGEAVNTKQLGVVCYALGSSPMTSTLVGLGLAASAGRPYYVPFAHRALGTPAQLDRSETLRAIAQTLQLGVELVAHDLRSLGVVLAEAGCPIAGIGADTMMWSYLLDPDGDHSFEALARRELEREVKPIEELARQKGSKVRVPLDQVMVEDAMEWSAPRASLGLELASRLKTKLEEAGLFALWRDMEQPLVPLLVTLERQGILLDTEVLQRLSKECELELRSLEIRAHEIAGKAFNIHSPRQLETLLFDELSLKPVKRTKTSRSTDAETLEALSEQHPLPAVILEIRKLSKLKGTYLDALPGLVDKKTGRLHTEWHQEVAATGRISSSDPNLQNIPIRSELGRSIRAAFIAPPGHLLISADYSQIELRVLAHLSEDAVLLDAFRRGQDIHLRTAMEIFEVPEDQVNDEHRRRAKAVNFGVIYGQGDSALAKSLGIERSVAGAFIATYFERYEGVRRFMEATLETARASQAVHTLLGRRRLIPEINERNRARRLAAERVARNTPIQGTAADLLKLAMLKLAEPVTPGTRMLLTVHDELVFETPADEVELAKERIREAMQGVMTLAVPLVVHVGAGPNWRAAH